MRLIVEIELVDEIDGKLFFNIVGTNKMIGLTQLQADVLESSEPEMEGMSTVDAVAIARRFASELSETLIPLCIDFGGVRQALVSPTDGQATGPLPVPAQAPKPSPVAHVAREAAPVAPAQQPSPAQPGPAHSTIEEELEALGIDTGVTGGGKRDTHPFSSTTTQE